MSFDLQPILDRTKRAMAERKFDEWEDPKEDAMVLSLFVRRLIRQVQDFNAGAFSELPLDLCPACASDTWDRPTKPEAVGNPDYKGDVRDYTRRQCRECGAIRPEPPKPTGRRAAAQVVRSHTSVDAIAAYDDEGTP